MIMLPFRVSSCAIDACSSGLHILRGDQVTGGGAFASFKCGQRVCIIHFFFQYFKGVLLTEYVTFKYVVD